MPLGIGEYPKEYNAKVHGPYNPGRFYGKADVHLSEVKLGEVGSWISRRSLNPLDMGKASSRFYWRWAQRWLFVKKTTAAPVVQLVLGGAAFYYYLNYPFLKTHRHTKYH